MVTMWTPVVTHVVVLSVLLLIGDLSLQAVDGRTRPSSFAFSTFPAEDGSILTSGNCRYNATLNSYDMTHNPNLPDCVNPWSNGSYPCSWKYRGRVMHKEKVQMIDVASRKVASFTFSFHTDPNFTTIPCSSGFGQGMTFIFTSTPNISISDKRFSSGMCSFDYRNKSATNRAFALKFDSSLFVDKNWPVEFLSNPGNIGLIISNKGNATVTNHNLCGNNTICDFFCDEKGDFTAWIDYDCAGQTLQVRSRAGSLRSGEKPADAVLSDSNVVLDEVMDEETYVGFSSATANPSEDIQIHRISSWNFNSSGITLDPSPSSSPVQSHPKSQAGLIAGIGAAGLGAALMGLLAFCYFKHKNRTSSNKKPTQVLSTSGLATDTTSRPYTFKELSSITKSFNDSELLSSGAFGDVYRGTPPSGAPLVAVKRIRHDKEHGQASFLAEANSLRQIRHRNLLQLRGWCEAKEDLFLVCDFLSNGSLDKWLHDPNPSPHDPGQEPLPWAVRRSILAGVASGLEYLHEGWVQCVLHRDIKSSNVMLDADFSSHLGDFGLVCLVDHRKMQKTTMLAGTLGYMAPEMRFTGRATKESDVYAFGVSALEVVCGRRPFMDLQDGDQPGDFLLLERVRRAHEAGNLAKMVDSRLVGRNNRSDHRISHHCSIDRE